MGRKASGAPGPLAAAAASEVRAELGRRGLTVSSLDGVIGSHSYVFARLSPEKATMPLNLNDTAAIEEFFGWPGLEVLRRATAMIEPETFTNSRGYTAEDEASIRRSVDSVDRRVTKGTKRH